MRIVIDHKGSEAFYKEVVNIAGQYRRLIRKPERKLENLFRSYGCCAVASGVLTALWAMLFFRQTGDTLSAACMAAMAVMLVISLALLYGMNRYKKRMMSDDRTSVLTIDETGVELNKEGSQIVKLAWDNVAFVRVFQESVSFLSRDASGLMLSVEKQWAGRIVPYLRENVPQLKIIE